MDLQNGDCLEIMKDLDENSVDLMFADLPYGQTSCKWDTLINLELFWKEINRVCKDDAAMIFTCTAKFGYQLIKSNEKNFRYDLVWVKSSPCGFLNAKKMPMKKHELIYVFYNKIPKIYTENIELHHQHKFLNANKVVRTDKGCDGLYGKESHKVFIYDDKGKLRNNEPRYEPPLPNSVIRDTKDYTNNSVLYGNIKRPDCMRKNNESMYNPPLPNSIIEIKSEKRKHATQKPVPLMEWILKYYSREGDVVLDPTMGSGSMGVACINMKRLFIGIEKDENIFDIAFNRLTIEV
jgi:site-specific DNA-methyltransferase (adenine-specific)|tara:strand:- start:34 stop:912 length:879 start_codon:yes stop_codon:yes gene_type:complete